MIKYALKCQNGHRFEGWFSNSADYDAQAAAGALTCPVCDTSDISKDIMAPAIATGRRKEAARTVEAISAMREAARKARAYVEKNFDNVGKRFPEEARKIHYGESEERGIYGVATPDEVKELTEEGVNIAPLPAADPPAETAKKKLN